jgi:hypothetical protein
MPYDIRFAESVDGHLQALTAGERARVRRAIEVQLTDEPLKETRNRKPLRPNPLARGSCASAGSGCSTMSPRVHGLRFTCWRSA